MIIFKKKKKNIIITRDQCKQVNIGLVKLGGKNKIAIQSMITHKTSDTINSIKQINQLFAAGCDLVRISVFDKNDADALKTIVKKVNKPLIADIHYNFVFAIKAIEAGIKKIRINPNNIGSKDHLIYIIQKANEHNVAIRIGINCGSLKETNFKTHNELIDFVIKQMQDWIAFFEKNHFFNLVLSIKCSDSKLNTVINEKLATISHYPIHLGLTEAGDDKRAIIKSCISLLPLLNKNIGNTIRISINGDPINEVYACKILLKDLGLLNNYPNLIACPLCGRNQFNTSKWVNEISRFIMNINKNITIGIMGCVVNGIGESANCDIAVCVINKDYSNIYINKKICYKNINNKSVIKTLKKIIISWIGDDHNND